MIYIQKRRTPAVVSMKAKELIKAPENDYSAISLPNDSGKLRHLFDQMPKEVIREALDKEQHGLCAY